MQMPLSQRAVLLISSIGLIPIALSYGAAPNSTVPILFGFPADTVNAAHIFRAVMGLYFGMVVLWLAGFFNHRFTTPALLSLVAFMFGLAAGRLLSILLDGTPSPLLIGYFFLEVIIGAIGLWSLRKVAV
jgi:hypothetical protein